MEHCGPVPGSEHYLSFPSVDGSSPRSTPCCGGVVMTLLQDPVLAMLVPGMGPGTSQLGQ